MKKCCLVLIMFIYACACLADWPMFLKDASHTAYIDYTIIPPLQIDKEIKLTEPIVSSPVFVDGVIYVGTLSGNIYAISIETGKVLFKYFAGFNGKTSPIYASAAFAYSKVVVANSNGIIYGLNAKTGRKIFSYNANGAIYSSPAIYEGKIYIGVGAPNPGLLCLDLNGKKIFKYKTKSPVHNSPVVYAKKVCFGTNRGYVYSINANTGRLFFKPYKSKAGLEFSSPAITKNGDLIFATVDPRVNVEAINSALGSKVFKKGSLAGLAKKVTLLNKKIMHIPFFDPQSPTPESEMAFTPYSLKIVKRGGVGAPVKYCPTCLRPEKYCICGKNKGRTDILYVYNFTKNSSVIADENFAYFVCGKPLQKVVALGLKTQHIVWSYPISQSGDVMITATPFISGDLLYVAGADGRLFAFDKVTGDKKFEWGTGFEIVASPIGTIYNSKGKIIVCGKNGSVLVLEGDIKKPEVIASKLEETVEARLEYEEQEVSKLEKETQEATLNFQKNLTFQPVAIIPAAVEEFSDISDKLNACDLPSLAVLSQEAYIENLRSDQFNILVTRKLTEIAEPDDEVLLHAYTGKLVLIIQNSIQNIELFDEVEIEGTLKSTQEFPEVVNISGKFSVQLLKNIENLKVLLNIEYKNEVKPVMAMMPYGEGAVVVSAIDIFKLEEKDLNLILSGISKLIGMESRVCAGEIIPVSLKIENYTKNRQVHIEEVLPPDFSFMFPDTSKSYYAWDLALAPDTITQIFMLLMVPEKVGEFELQTDIYVENAGDYVYFKTVPLKLNVQEDFMSLFVGILDDLDLLLSQGEDVNKVDDISNSIFELVLNPAASKEDLQKHIEILGSLYKVAESFNSLKKRDLLLKLSNLLRMYSRWWYFY